MGDRAEPNRRVPVSEGKRESARERETAREDREQLSNEENSAVQNSVNHNYAAIVTKKERRRSQGLDPKGYRRM